MLTNWRSWFQVGCIPIQAKASDRDINAANSMFDAQSAYDKNSILIEYPNRYEQLHIYHSEDSFEKFSRIENQCWCSVSQS